jgi:hypothetical protein
VLDMALLFEKLIVQDITPSNGYQFPKRALWMAMYGYFGNWYKPEERKWALLAAKRNVHITKKLYERGDMKLVNELP